MAVYYCGQSCQRGHWKSHKKVRERGGDKEDTEKRRGNHRQVRRRKRIEKGSEKTRMGSIDGRGAKEGERERE